MTFLFDSHAHLSFFEEDALCLLERAKKAHVSRIMNIAVDAASFQKNIALKKEHPSYELFLAAATTPHDVTSAEDPFFFEIKKAAKEGVLTAIGECGLDYFHAAETKNLQKEIFQRYLSLAIEEDLPLIVHCRDAFSDLLSILKEFPHNPRGVIHCFTGTYEEAKALLDRGWHISFSGIITYPKSIALQNVVKQLPLDRILVETDCPYLAPQSVRGKKNEPGFLTEIVLKIASLKQIYYEEIASTTFQNTTNFFKIPF